MRKKPQRDILDLTHVISLVLTRSPLDLANRLRARDVESVPAVKLPSIKRNRIKRDSSEAIDAINLNIEDDQGFTMTLVESSDDEEEDAA